METAPREVMAELSLGGAPGAVARAATAARAAPAHFAPLYAPVGAPSLIDLEAPALIDLEAPARVRLGLQQRAATNLRSHVTRAVQRSEEHTSELQSRLHLVCRLLLEKKK